MKWKISLPESSMLLYYWAKLTGMAPFTVIENRFHPPTILGKLYTVTIIAGFSVLTLLTLTTVITILGSGCGYFELTKNWSLFESLGSVRYSELTTNWSLFESLFSLVVVPSTMLIFLIKHKKIVRVMNKLRFITEELEKLDIPESQGKFFKNMFTTVVTANACLVATQVTMMYVERKWLVHMLLKLAIDSWLTLNMVLIFTGIMFYITQHFKSLNQKLLNVFEPRREVSSHHRSRISVASKNPGKEIQAGDKCLTDFQRIREIELLHLELCDLIDRTIRLFAIPIMFYIIQCFVVLTVSSFWIFFIINNSSQPRDSFAEMVSFVVDNILFALLRMSIVITQLLIIAHVSVATCCQGNATRAVVSKVWDHLRPMEIKNELLMFSTQLLHKPVSVSIFGIFKLDYSLIFEVFCSVAVYFIITVQFDSRVTNRGA